MCKTVRSRKRITGFYPLVYFVASHCCEGIASLFNLVR